MSASPQRLVSLDAFRGFVIAAMLLVNNVIWNAATPRQLMHAPWGQGVTFTDMVFPWFLFAMGVAIPFSGAGREQGGWSFLLRVARRAAILMALGVLVDSTVYHHLTVGMGVLQLLGLAYLVGALAATLPVWARLSIAAVILAGHSVLLKFVPVPGAGAGVLTEGQNIIRYLNQTYLARYHLAGVISVAPTTALVLAGTAVGEVLCREPLRRTANLGILCSVAAALTVGGWLWQRDLPLNKALWTSSYILFAGGLGSAVLALCYLLFDLAPLRPLAFPFAVFGANAIVVYVASILFKVHVLQEWQHRAVGGQLVSLQQAILDYLAARAGPISGAWIYTIGFIVFWWLILLVLYRHRVFVRV